MQEKLIIYLHTEKLSAPSFVRINDVGLISMSKMHAEGEELGLLAQDKEVIVLVPAEDVVLTHVTLPKMNRARLLKALPFAIEDQLISEVNTLHFAFLQADSEGNIPVAIVSIEKMQNWLLLLQSWQIKPDAFIPASLALPLENNAWTLMVYDSTFMMKRSLHDSFFGDTINLKVLLDQALSSAKEMPEKIYLYHLTRQKMGETLNVNIPIEEAVMMPLDRIESFAKTIVKFPGINLLQGVFSVKKSKTEWHTIGKRMAYFALAWVFLLFLYPTVSYFMLKNRVDHLNLQVAEIYQHHFHDTNIDRAKVRMQEKLQKLSANDRENRIWLLLAYLSKSVANTPSVKLKRFGFQNNQITVELAAQSSDDLSQFTDSLTREGLSVKQQNASLTGSQIHATVVIE